MLKNYLPNVMNSDEKKVVDSILSSLTYLKQEALREGQAFIAYAIDDAIIHVKDVRKEKYCAPIPQNER